MAKQQKDPKKAATSAKSWKGKGAVAEATIPLPSGNTIRLRRIPLDALLKRGLVPNSLLPMMQGALAGKRMEAAANEFTTDQLVDMLSLQDAVTMECSIDPEVHPVPDDESDRDENLLYVDEVDMTDKAFIFQWAVGGTADVGKFRDRFSSSVADVLDGESVGSSAE